MWLFSIGVVYKRTRLNQGLGYNNDHSLVFMQRHNEKSTVNIPTRLAVYYTNQ